MGQSQPRSPSHCPPCWGNRGDRWVLSLRPGFSSENCQQSYPGGITGKTGVTHVLHREPPSVKSRVASAAIVPGWWLSQGAANAPLSRGSPKPQAGTLLPVDIGQVAVLCWLELWSRDPEPRPLQLSAAGILVPSLLRESSQEQGNGGGSSPAVPEVSSIARGAATAAKQHLRGCMRVCCHMHVLPHTCALPHMCSPSTP